MKLFVKRDQFKRFKKANIEISTTGHLATIQLAIGEQVSRYKKAGWDKDPSMQSDYQELLEVQHAIDVKNEIPW